MRIGWLQTERNAKITDKPKPKVFLTVAVFDWKLTPRNSVASFVFVFHEKDINVSRKRTREVELFVDDSLPDKDVQACLEDV